jgi:hypothetical protein
MVTIPLQNLGYRTGNSLSTDIHAPERWPLNCGGTAR